MCGIFGIFNATGKIHSSQIRAATTAIRHRGPDDEGYLLANTKTQNIKLFGGEDSITEYLLQQNLAVKVS